MPGELLGLLCHLLEQRRRHRIGVGRGRELHGSPAGPLEHRQAVDPAGLRVHELVGDQGDPEAARVILHRGSR